MIEKLLKFRCLKWARIAHLDICNTSYGQKKGRESNWQFDSRPLKVGNQPDSLFPCVQETCNIPLERYRRGLQLFFRPHCDQRSAKEVMRPQSRGSPSCWNSGTPTWNPQKAIWMWPPWRAIEYIIRGKVVASPKSGP